MTELQIGLIGLGGVAVVGVIAYNTWQEYQQRKLAEKLLDVPPADVLLGTAAADETLAASADSERAQAFVSSAASESHVVRASSQRIEPVLRFSEETQEPPPAARNPVEAHDAAHGHRTRADAAARCDQRRACRVGERHRRAPVGSCPAPPGPNWPSGPGRPRAWPVRSGPRPACAQRRSR